MNLKLLSFAALTSFLALSSYARLDSASLERMNTYIDGGILPENTNGQKMSGLWYDRSQRTWKSGHNPIYDQFAAMTYEECQNWDYSQESSQDMLYWLNDVALSRMDGKISGDEAMALLTDIACKSGDIGASADEYSIGIGDMATASDFSYAQGHYTMTSNYSFGLGDFVDATDNSFAFGKNAQADTFSFAFGSGVYALGKSFAFGEQINSKNNGSGDFTMTFGRGLYSYSFHQITLGRFSEVPEFIDSMSSYDWNPTDPLFVLGNGASENERSNALVVLKNGDTKVNGNLESDTLKVRKPSPLISMGKFGRREEPAEY